MRVEVKAENNWIAAIEKLTPMYPTSANMKIWKPALGVETTANTVCFSVPEAISPRPI